MSEFKREERYIVIKRKYLDEAKIAYLNGLLRFYLNVESEECVVVEADWPIYGETWENIERLTKSLPSLKQECEAIGALLKELASSPKVKIPKALRDKIALALHGEIPKPKMPTVWYMPDNHAFTPLTRRADHVEAIETLTEISATESIWGMVCADLPEVNRWQVHLSGCLTDDIKSQIVGICDELKRICEEL